MKIDLHSHTRYSDGQLTPAELVDRAQNMQLDVLAITDHDTVMGVEVAMAYQAQQKRNMTIIAGVEISTGWHGFDIHILGLNVNHKDPQFLQRLQQQSETREIRAKEMDAKLVKAGVEGIYVAAKELAGVGQITRAHFARVMVSRGIVNNMEAVFKKYLGKGKRAHVKPQWIDIAEAVKWIQDAGGKAVLAHPRHYGLSAKWLRRLIVAFKQFGGDGMEVIHSHLSPDNKRQLADFAREYDLLASAGSDFHFPNRWTELGRNLAFCQDLTPVWHDWNLNSNNNRVQA